MHVTVKRLHDSVEALHWPSSIKPGAREGNVYGTEDEIGAGKKMHE